MKVIKHTITCPIPGYEALEVSFNVAMTHAQLDYAQRTGQHGAGLLDLPNWEEVAPELELCDAEGQPLPKPIPMTEENLPNLPMALATFLLSGIGMQLAVGDYIGQLSPNYKRR